MKVKESDIVEEFLGCPYCGCQRSADDFRGCCGESSDHFEMMYVIKSGEVISEHEITIVEDKISELTDVQRAALAFSDIVRKP